MLRSTALVALLATVTATGGCAHGRGSGALTVGGVIAGAGLLLAVVPVPVDADHNGVNDTALDDHVLGFYPGLLVVGLGAAIMVMGGVEYDSEPKVTPLSVQTQIGAKSLALAAAPPPSVATSVALATEPSGAPPAIVERRRLPELPASTDTLRLAKQVRTATDHGQCEAAWIMWNQLLVSDASYAEALRTSSAMAGCAR
jgi:hypothetical protein